MCSQIPFSFPRFTVDPGPIIGGPFLPGVNVPRAISLEHYHKLCPNPRVLQTAQPRSEVGLGGSDVMVKKWVEILNGIDDPCVEIDDKSDAMFDIW